MNSNGRHGSAFPFRALIALMALAVGCVLASNAYAAKKGSVAEYPVGMTMGTPSGALPPPGLYVIWKPNYSHSYSLNGSGERTGVTSTAWASNAQLLWVPGIKVFGATYGAFIRNIGEVNVTLRTPTGMTVANAGVPDTELVPINLSWNIAKHWYVDAELGIYLNDGDYKNQPGRINIGQKESTIEPNFSVTYMSDKWLFSVHPLFDINGWNHDAGFVDGQKVSYRNGTTFAMDWTAFRRTAQWNYGLVGYFYRQITADKGPIELNGGRPWEYAAGVGVSHRFGKVNFIATYTHDYLARNIGKKNMLLVVLSVRAL